MMTHFNVEWIRSFLAVVENEGFINAASALRRAQSRISAHVASLESELGAQLFDRKASPVALTLEGKVFLPRAQRAIHELESGAADVAALQGETTGRLKIGSFPSASAMILAPLIKQYMTLHPAVTIELHEGPARWVEDNLMKNQIEIALRAVEPVPRRGTLRLIPIFDEPFLLVTRPGELGDSTPSEALDRLGTLPVITIGEPVFEEYVGYEYRNVLDITRDMNVRRMVVSQPATLMALVRAGVGVGLIGKLAADMVGTEELTIREFGRERGRTVGLFWNSSGHLSHPARRFIELLRQAELPLGLRSIPWDPESLFKS